MKRRELFSLVLLTGLLLNPLYPCSEHYIEPVFQYKHAPENPFENFAAGKIGILKPTYRRVVLFAAYRYLNNQGFSADEQKALVSVWNAEFKNEEPRRNESDEIVKKWLEKRRSVVREEEPLPPIYLERQFGGYDFFPNCNVNAFETAIETLSERIAGYGAEDKDVAEWLKGQDTVFSNCAGGRQLPPEVGADSPVWLRKDRQYQIAAAEFYALDLDAAKNGFEMIALDAESPWRETAAYLVGRTLVRQAGFTKDETERRKLYEQAENHFILMRGNKFDDSAQKLVNLIKVRTRPRERTRELAQNLLFGQSGEHLRQDLIDYTWLLDKFETDILRAEENRREDALIASFAESDRILREKITAGLAGTGVSVEVSVLKGEVTLKGKIPAEKYEQVLSVVKNADPPKFTDNLTRVTENPDGSTTYQGGDLDSYSLYSGGATKEQWEAIRRGELFRIVIAGNASFDTFFARAEETDEEIFARFWGRSQLSDEEAQKIKAAIKEARAEQIRNKFDGKPQPDYEGGYRGEEKLSLSLVPDFLRSDDLTDWLFTFQTEGAEAYLHALEKWQRNRTDLWLAAAIAKARKDSKDIDFLMEKAGYVERNSTAFPTVAYHRARILIEQEKPAQAARLLDGILDSDLDLPVSSRNEFAAMRMKIAATLDEFLKNSTRRAFTYADYSRSVSVDELIENMRATFGPEAQLDELFAEYKFWEKRQMFDDETVRIVNEHFPLAVLLEAYRSPALPVYLRGKLARVIWTRATILEDDEILRKMAPEIISLAPEAEQYLRAKSASERRFAALFVIYRHKDFIPFLESGINNSYQSYDQANGWWCALSAYEYDEKGNEIPRIIPPKPAFLTPEQSKAAQSEMKKLVEAGSAPDYLAEQAKEWFSIAPKDGRLPEVLFQAVQASEEYRYGCGNSYVQTELENLLLENFPDSPWARKADR